MPTETATWPPENVPTGTFTVVFADNERRTIRIKHVAADHPSEFADWLFAKFLSGPDNDANYTNFAFAKPGNNGFALKTQYRNAGLIADALRSILTACPTVRHEMGVTWARESGHCYRCGRTLTVPASIEASVGPTCAEILGIPYGLAA